MAARARTSHGKTCGAQTRLRLWRWTYTAPNGDREEFPDILTERQAKSLKDASKVEGSLVKKAGLPCQCKLLLKKGKPNERGEGRCKFHGGMSTGPKTPEGKARSYAAWRAGLAKWREQRRRAKQAQLQAS